MQTQQRAESGIKERIVGYYGSDWTPEPDELDMDDLRTMAEVGAFHEVDFKDLPEHIRDVVLAENHRMKTGQILTVDEFKKRGGELESQIQPTNK
jgi:hypothetical protein